MQRLPANYLPPKIIWKKFFIDYAGQLHESSVYFYLFQLDNELRKKAEEAWRQAYRLFAVEDGWTSIPDTSADVDGISVYSQHVERYGRLLKLEVSIFSIFSVICVHKYCIYTCWVINFYKIWLDLFIQLSDNLCSTVIHRALAK